MDTGLQSLVTIAQFHRLPAESEQLAHQFAKPGQVFGDDELLLAARAITLKAKRLKITLSKVHNSVLPAIAKLDDGSYVILARLSSKSEPADEKQQPPSLLIHDLRDESPKSLAQEEFISLWSGELILLTRRQGLGESLQQKFDISWFIPALVKNRKLFGEVLIASFFYNSLRLSHRFFFRW